LTEMTRGMGIAAAIPQLSPALDQVELIALADRRVLMVVVTRDHQVRNRVIVLDEPVTSDELASIRNYINRNFSGWTLESVRKELAERLEHASAAYDTILRKLTLLSSKGLLDIDPSVEFHMDGVSNLVGLDLHLTKEKMRELFRALEEKKRVLHLLDRFLEKPAGEVAVQIGLGGRHPPQPAMFRVGVPAGLLHRCSAALRRLGATSA